jgi:L-threonylcarbamoyladenylate synthase
LDAHYAPRTPLALIEPEALTETMAALRAKQRQVVGLAIDKEVAQTKALQTEGLQSGSVDREGVSTTYMPSDPQAYAQALYAQLRSLDQVGADLILVEQPPKTTAWQGINDRLQRAAFDSAGVLERLLA